MDPQICWNATCNGVIFAYGGFDHQQMQYEGSSDYLIVMISISGVVMLYLLYKMCRLCSLAFSYSNFHIHETYKLYALGLINLIILIFARKSQMDLLANTKLLNQDQQQLPCQQRIMIVPDILTGYDIVNNIFAVLSIFTNDYMHLFNAFTWLMISLDCDFTLKKESHIVNKETMDEEEEIRNKKRITRKRVNVIKNFLLYFTLPALLTVSVIGTLKNNFSQWCSIVRISVVAGSLFPLVIFGVAIALYASKFADSQVSWITKTGLTYQLIAMIVRALYFIVLIIKVEQLDTKVNNGDTSWGQRQLSFGGNVLNLLYFIFCTLAPIIWMSLLSQLQLKNEQFTLLRRSSGLIFRSTVI